MKFLQTPSFVYTMLKVILRSKIGSGQKGNLRMSSILPIKRMDRLTTEAKIKTTKGSEQKTAKIRNSDYNISKLDKCFSPVKYCGTHSAASKIFQIAKIRNTRSK